MCNTIEIRISETIQQVDENKVLQSGRTNQTIYFIKLPQVKWFKSFLIQVDLEPVQSIKDSRASVKKQSV